METSIAILGAGIGGLSLAAALQRAGLSFRVYEQAESLGEVGAGLGLWSNATRCLESVGIDSEFWSRFGCEVHIAEVGTPAGKVLSRCAVRPIAEKVGAGSYVVHRADLHTALAKRVERDSISLSKQLTGLSQSDDGVVLRFADGTEEQADLAVGADGLKSRVRAELFGDEPPLYAGQTCYRGIAELTIKDRHVLREIQGAGLRAAVIPLDDNRVYWWATENVPPGGKRSPVGEREHLLKAFADWAFHVPEAIEATGAGAILRNDLYDRPPLTSWSKGHVTLLGDAAHPTTPNLGQGACMAIEDAFVLGQLLAKSATATSFAEYEQRRKARCEAIVKESRRFGWVGGWSNPLAVGLRETLIKLMPESAMRRSMEKHIAVSI